MEDLKLKMEEIQNQIHNAFSIVILMKNDLGICQPDSEFYGAACATADILRKVQEEISVLREGG